MSGQPRRSPEVPPTPPGRRGRVPQGQPGDPGQCTTIIFRDAGFLDSTGFAHCPGAPPADTTQGGEGTRYEPVDGAWYIFTTGW